MTVNKKMHLAALGLAVSGLALAPAAFAAEMEVKAKVVNSLEAEVVESLNFGEIFVTEAKNDSSASGVLAPQSAGNGRLSGISSGTSGKEIPFISLDGATRGQVSVAAPGNNTTAFTVTLGGLVDGILAEDDCDAGTGTDDVLVLEHESGDPGIAKFHVHTWKLAAGDGAGAATGFTGNRGTVTPTFNQRPVNFYLGATISTECANKGYEDEGEYLGTLTIDVGY